MVSYISINLGTVWFTAKWGKRGTDTDTKKSKEIRDITTILFVLYALEITNLPIVIAEYKYLEELPKYLNKELESMENNRMEEEN